MKNEQITIKNRMYNIIEKQPISNFPNIAKEQPNVEFFFIAEGKKGALVDGYILKDGSLRVF